MAPPPPSPAPPSRSDRLLRTALVVAAPLLGLAAAGVVALEGRGRFEQIVVVIVLMILVGAPALVLAGGCALLRLFWRHRRVDDLAAVAFASSLFFASILPSLPVGHALCAGDKAEAQAYARALVRVIERERGRSGDCPEDVAALVRRLGPLPRIFREGGWFYGRRGRDFEIGYPHPDLQHGGIVYSSATGRWKRWG